MLRRGKGADGRRPWRLLVILPFSSCNIPFTPFCPRSDWSSTQLIDTKHSGVTLRNFRKYYTETYWSLEECSEIPSDTCFYTKTDGRTLSGSLEHTREGGDTNKVDVLVDYLPSVDLVHDGEGFVFTGGVSGKGSRKWRK